MSSISSKKISFFSDKADENIVILLPILNALATVLVPYTPDGLINIGMIRAFVIIVFGIYFLLNYFTIKFNVAVVTFIFLFYILFCVIVGKDYLVGFNVYFKFFVATIHILLGLHYGSRPFFMRRISIGILIMLGIYVLDFIISNIFNVGSTSYKGVENEINFGGSGVNLAKCVSAILLMVPIMFYDFKSTLLKRILIVLTIAGVIHVLFAFKRSGVTSLFLGYFIILLFYPNPLKKIQFSIRVLVFALLLTPFVYEQIIDNYQAREKAIRLDDQENLEDQARYVEYQMGINEWQRQSWDYKLFGAELFNSRLYFRTRRTFHTDYMTLLAGAGITGVFLLLFHYYSMIKTLWQKNIQFRTELNQLQFAVGLALVVSMVLYGFSGLVQAIEPRATILLFIGALIARPAFPNT
jgi:hypothetical protein